MPESPFAPGSDAERAYREGVGRTPMYQAPPPLPNNPNPRPQDDQLLANQAYAEQLRAQLAARQPSGHGVHRLEVALRPADAVVTVTEARTDDPAALTKLNAASSARKAEADEAITSKAAHLAVNLDEANQYARLRDRYEAAVADDEKYTADQARHNEAAQAAIRRGHDHGPQETKARQAGEKVNVARTVHLGLKQAVVDARKEYHRAFIEALGTHVTNLQAAAEAKERDLTAELARRVVELAVAIQAEKDAAVELGRLASQFIGRTIGAMNLEIPAIRAIPEPPPTK